LLLLELLFFLGFFKAFVERFCKILKPCVLAALCLDTGCVDTHDWPDKLHRWLLLLLLLRLGAPAGTAAAAAAAAASAP
jgi:hypothetical protein